MSVSAETGGTPQSVIELLLRLGRPGCRLRTEARGIVLESATTAARPAIPSQAVAAAQTAGFLAAETGGDGSLVLSPAGRQMLRGLLMAPNAVRARRLRAASQAGSPDLMSKPHAERRSTVQQLAHRKDPHGRPLLGEVHVAAALRFANDFARAGLQPRVTARWSADAIPERRRRGAPGAGVELSEAVAAAQSRVRAALAALGGMLADLVLDVCGFDHGMERVEGERGWSRGSGRQLLKAALEQLAHHYGMIVPPRATGGGVQQWSDGAYRPSAETWRRR